MRIATLQPTGGPVALLHVLIERKSPLVYCETLSDGTKIIRNAKEEEMAARRYEV